MTIEINLASGATVTIDGAEKSVETMGGSDLVRAFNFLVELAERTPVLAGKQRAVSRFASPDVGRKRVLALMSSLKAARTSDEVVTREEAGPSVSEPVSEESDMATRKDKKKAAAPKAEAAPKATKAAAPRAPKAEAAPKANGAQPGSIRAITEEFNSLVPQAAKLGHKQFKHHTSLFESKVKGEKQLGVLKAAIVSGEFQEPVKEPKAAPAAKVTKAPKAPKDPAAPKA